MTGAERWVLMLLYSCFQRGIGEPLFFPAALPIGCERAVAKKRYSGARGIKYGGLRWPEEGSNVAMQGVPRAL